MKSRKSVYYHIMYKRLLVFIEIDACGAWFEWHGNCGIIFDKAKQNEQLRFIGFL